MTLFLIVAVFLGVVLGVTSWALYFGPRTQAFKTGRHIVSVWAGLGTLILWEPGETYVFMKDKRIHDVGDPGGGFRTIFAMRGEEAIGPFSLKSELMTWEDEEVLTREAQQVHIKLGIWWRIGNPKAYFLRVSEELHDELDRLRVGIHESAVRWLKVLVESAVRSHVNQLGVAEVISAQATGFLQIERNGNALSGQESQRTFEQLVQAVRENVYSKIKEYGIEIQRLEVQEITLPADIQAVINKTREAFLLPIRSQKEAEARQIELRAAAEVLGVDTVGLNELLKNFQGANFSYLPQFLQSLFGMVSEKATIVAEASNHGARLSSGAETKALPASKTMSRT